MNNDGFVICAECFGTGEIITNKGLTKKFVIIVMVLEN
jgi:hypothetical protein